MTTETGTWNRRATFALAALVAIALVSLVWLVHPWYEATDETNDASIYIACARSILRGEGYAYLNQPFTVRPPGWSLLIAAVLWMRGLDFHALNLLTSLCGIACVAFVFVHARTRIGTVLAFLLALGVWFHDEFQRLCNEPMSDVPGAALLFACFALERLASKRPSIRRDILLALCIGLSTYVRSVVVLLVPAIAVARTLQRWSSRREPGVESWTKFALTRLAPLAVCVFLVKLPWDARNAMRHPATPVEQNYLFDYSTAMWRVDGGDPSSARRPIAQIAGRVPERIQLVGALTASALRERESPFLAAAGWSALAAAAWIAWKRHAAAEAFALLYAGVLLVYFGFRDRLALPIHLVALVAVVDALLLVSARAGHERAARLALGALLLARPFFDFRPRAGWNELEQRHELYVAQSDAIARALEPTAVLAAPIGWHWSVYLDRPVWSTFFVAKRDGQDAVPDLLRRRAIDALILWPRMPSDRGQLAWAERQFGAPRIAGEVRIFRVPR